ncbi:MAG: von Willebrand factor type A domain-containing protein [Cyclobacteriaceae bacterium]|nr:von Willebrand factor type A domain-containing protein [Cyclobacteriaceae bacterium]
MKKIALSLIVLLLIGITLSAQDRTIVGKVTSADDGSSVPGVNVVLKGTTTGSVTDGQGNYLIHVPAKGGTLVFSFIGFTTQEIAIGISNRIDVVMSLDIQQLSEVVVTGYGIQRGLQGKVAGVQIRGNSSLRKKDMAAPSPSKYGLRGYGEYETRPHQNTEEYDGIQENIFHDPLKNPLSTFSIDVDAASYSNIRRFITGGQRPPKDAVRIEEMINYFDYEYVQPKGDDPFSINTEISTAPWNPKHKLVHIGLQGKNIPKENLPPSNLVFLIDVSGSMSDENKLPLLKTSFKMLVEQLREQDRIAIVVYAGAAGLVLPSTSGAHKRTIIDALDKLEAGGSTAGGAGIKLAYAIAKENFQKEGNNRVILATDGDFNVGESSNGGMERLIEAKREEGVFLTALGFGMGNYKDSKMETLADKGNGNYFYIDSILEAQKALVNEFGGTLFTIAKDVKLQIEFNPARVKAYRLIGYENRLLRDEDFNDDKKDAGELGSGHSVTALYEIIPVGVESEFSKVDDLKYQKTNVEKTASASKEIMTVKFRYKKPSGSVSKLIVHPLVDENTSIAETSDNFRWSAAVAGFGMLLRDSEYVTDFKYEDVLQLAQGARGKDENGYRVEFLNMVKSLNMLAARK